MIRLISRVLIALALPALLLCCSCKEKPQPDTAKPDYFSIMQFTADQWDTYRGQPFVLQKTVTLNGKTDSVLQSAYQVNWGEIFKIFFETDINDGKFNNKYDFQLLEESATQAYIYSYTAKEPGLFTQKLQVTADQFTKKIRNIYIETHKSTFWTQQTQKLFYSPVRVIQIQEHSSQLIGADKDLVIEYKF